MHRPLVVVLGCVLGLLFLLPMDVGALEPSAPQRVDPAPPVPGGPFPPEARYDPDLPTLESILGFDLGSWPAAPSQIRRVVETLAAASPRVCMEVAGESNEARPLIYAMISSPRNLARLEAIEEGLARLASAPTGGERGRDLEQLLQEMPVVVWVGASVHGGEASGADAALALLYHLAADQRETTREMLEELLVLIDPLQNPDGRSRMLARLTQWGGRVANVDHQSLHHRGGWPSPRGNHYFLDLNRDWFALSQPETRSKVQVLLRWRPQVTIDLHEMGSFDTYLFSPPREPMNPNLPSTTRKWWRRFSQVQARAFGERGWSCYTGEWNEEFNPNRGASWPLFTGAVAILEEQASTDGSTVKLPDGSLLRYRDAVNRHFVATLAVVQSAAAERSALLGDYLRARREAVSGGVRGKGAYLIDASVRPGVARRLAETLQAQGIEVRRASESFRVPGAQDYWGERRGERPFTPGCLIVAIDQPEGRLVEAILEFDPPLGSAFLTRERRQREAGQPSLLYETTAWSLAMAYGAETYRSDRSIRVASEPIDAARPLRGKVLQPGASYGFLLDARDGGATEALADLLTAGLTVRAAGEPFVAGGRAYGVGTLLLRRSENGNGLVEELERISRRTGARFAGIAHALSDEGPDLGGRRFRLLESPRTAVLAGSPFYQTTFGAVWFLLDRELRLPASFLRSGSLAKVDLDKYNVIIFPDASPGSGPGILAAVGPGGKEALESWVRRGGTLITLGEGGSILFEGEEPFGGLRARRQVLEELEGYDRERMREAGLPSLLVSEEALRAGRDTALRRPKEETAPADARIDPEEDEWQRRFSPQGVILRAELNPGHWLAAGVSSRVPVMVKTDLAFMSRQPVETIGRFADVSDLRLSGLLWPEARARWAGTSYLARERIAAGQVISFLGNPFYRAYFHGTGRLLINAILLGPGMGTAVRAEW